MKKILYGLMLVYISLTLIGCDSSLRWVSVSIAQYPDRIAYIAGQDSELDMSGCTIRKTSKAGTTGVESIAAEDYTVKKNTAPIDDSAIREIRHNIDFNVPGVYQVDIIYVPDLVCSFAIEVVNLDELVGE